MKTLQHTLAVIEAMNLDLIKFKATRTEDGYGWSTAYADQMALAYKRYLMLHAKYPEMTFAPDQDIDKFWHMHILDTRKYAADCDEAFGYFLHHFPYLGLRGEDDAKALETAFDDMQSMYLKEFGEPMPQRQATSAWCGLDARDKKAAWCGLDTEAKAAAWCGLDAPTTKQAAWCGLDSPTIQPKAAWCGLDSPHQKAS